MNWRNQSSSVIHVVLKGSNRADHLLRILLARRTGVQCWRKACHRQVFCDACELLHQPG